MLFCSDCGSQYRRFKQCQRCIQGDSCCEKCGSLYSNSNDLAAHAKKYHSTEKYICDDCQKIISCKGNLVRHQQSHQNICYPCDNCPKTFTRLSSLNEHKQKCMRTETSTYFCIECGKKLPLRGNLLQLKTFLKDTFTC